MLSIVIYLNYWIQTFVPHKEQVQFEHILVAPVMRNIIRYLTIVDISNLASASRIAAQTASTIKNQITKRFRGDCVLIVNRPVISMISLNIIPVEVLFNKRNIYFWPTDTNVVESIQIMRTVILHWNSLINSEIEQRTFGIRNFDRLTRASFTVCQDDFLSLMAELVALSTREMHPPLSHEGRCTRTAPNQLQESWRLVLGRTGPFVALIDPQSPHIEIRSIAMLRGMLISL